MSDIDARAISRNAARVLLTTREDAARDSCGTFPWCQMHGRLSLTFSKDNLIVHTETSILHSHRFDYSLRLAIIYLHTCSLCLCKDCDASRCVSTPPLVPDSRCSREGTVTEKVFRGEEPGADMTEPRPNWAMCCPGRGELTVSPELRNTITLQCYTEPTLHHHSAAFSSQPSPSALKV